MDIFDVNPRNIWNFRQNHPELVIKDCRERGFTEEQIRIVRQSLLVRGANKWFKVRRDLIAYKKQIKNELKKLNTEIPKLKMEMTKFYCNQKMIACGNKSVHDLENYYRKRIEYNIAKAELKLLMLVRGTLKSLCETDRWQIWEGKKLKDMNSIRASD